MGVFICSFLASLAKIIFSIVEVWTLLFLLRKPQPIFGFEFCLTFLIVTSSVLRLWKLRIIYPSSKADKGLKAKISNPAVIIQIIVGFKNRISEKECVVLRKTWEKKKKSSQ